MSGSPDAVVSETRHLDAEKRRQVDEQLKATGISRMGFKAATACIRKTAYEADPEGYVQRGRTERKHRRIGIRPAPDTRPCSPATCRRARHRLLRRAGLLTLIRLRDQETCRSPFCGAPIPAY
jgi:hypothetical protein